MIHAGFSSGNAQGFVIAGAIADIGLGLLVLARRTVPAALIGMIAVTISYLIAATLFVPSFWLAPMGPLVKAVPAVLLALFMLAIAPER